MDNIYKSIVSNFYEIINKIGTFNFFMVRMIFIPVNKISLFTRIIISLFSKIVGVTLKSKM
jgi:hypothetical protein